MGLKRIKQLLSVVLIIPVVLSTVSNEFTYDVFARETDNTSVVSDIGLLGETDSFDISGLELVGGLDFQELEPIEITDDELVENGITTISEEFSYNSTYADYDYWMGMGSDYYYNQLSEQYRDAWDSLERTLVGYLTSTEDIPLNLNEYAYIRGSEPAIPNYPSADGTIDTATRNDIYNLAEIFFLSNPQYYFLANSVSMSYRSNGNGTIDIWFGINAYKQFADGDARAAATEQFKNRIDSWISQINNCDRAEEKEAKATQLLMDATTYQYVYSSYNERLDQSAYSLVCMGKTVCAGYTATMSILLNATGVETITVTSSNHAWNRVNLYGDWYNVDVTNIDYNNANYIFYNRSETTLTLRDSMWSPESLWSGKLPVSKYDSCVSSGYSSGYFNNGNFTYFYVNRNSSRGSLLARAVDKVNGTTSSVPVSTTNGSSTFSVVNAGSTSLPVETNPTLRFTEQPQVSDIHEGDKVTLKAEAEGGSGELTYAWSVKIGNNSWYNVSLLYSYSAYPDITRGMSGYDTKELTIDPVTLNLNGVGIRCEVTDGSRTVASDELTLSVREKLAITSQPEPIVVRDGEEASFTVEAKGADVKYQWYVQYPDTTEWRSIADANKSTYTFLASSATPTGTKYKCTLTDKFNETVDTEDVSIELIDKLRVTSMPEDVTVNEGDTARFKIEASGTDIRFKWQYSSDSVTWTDVDTLNTVLTGVEVTGADTDTLDVKTVEAVNGYNFRCTVTDKTDESVNSDIAQLTVIPALTITKQPENKNVHRGESFGIGVEVAGENLSYQWQIKGSEGNWLDIYGADKKDYSASVDTGFTDGTEFRCRIADDSGKVKLSDTAKISVVELTITSQPSDSKVQDGNTAMFKVMVAGDPGVVTYQWQKMEYNDGDNWQNVAGATADTYSFAAHTADTESSYRCIITDSLGKRFISEAAKLKISGELQIVKQLPGDVTAHASDMASLEVLAVGHDVIYQWQRRDPDGEWVDLVDETDNIYEFYIPETRPDMTGYRCVIRDSAGSELTSDEVILHVIQLPSLSKQPVNVVGYAGEELTLTVQMAQGCRPVKYTWYVKKQKETAWSRLGESVGNEYSFVPATDMNNAVYRCEIEDILGAEITSNQAVMRVYTPITINRQTENTKVYSGDRVNLMVEAAGESLKYQWQVLAPGGTWTSLRGATKATYVITTNRSFVSGTKYRCVITDLNGRSVITDEASVTIIDKLAIRLQPGNPSAYPDENVRLSIAVNGEITSYEWQYYDKTDKVWKTCIAGVGAGETAPTAASEGASYLDNTHEYIFAEDRYESGTQFRCVVKDSAGKTVTSSVVTLKRISHMALTDKSDNVILHKGEKTTIKVAMTGDGLKYQWQSYNESSGKWVNISRATSNSYAITTNTRTATGTTRYRCVITDSGNETAESRGIDTEIKVTVTDTLRISRQPSGMGMYVDKDGKLTVEAAGMIKSFQWQYYDPAEKVWKNCSAGTGAYKTAEGSGEGVHTAVDGVTKYIDGKSEYSFRASDYEEVGTSVQLRCVVTDVTGKTVTSSAATVRRISHMALTDKSDNVILHKGERTTIRVAMTGDGLRYQWQSYNESKAQWVNISRATSNSYAITTNTRTATGTTRYRCVITDSGNETAESRGIDTEIKVTVTDTLRISRQPSGMGMYVDKDGKLTVEAAGMIKSFQWQYYDPSDKTWKNCSAGTGANKTAEGSGEGVYTAVDGVTKYIDGKSEYSFSASDYEAVGSSVQLRCVVTDVTGKTVTSSAATVRRISHMERIEKSDNVILHKGERTTIRVAMTGDGLKYQWQSYNESSDKWVNISRATSNSYAITTNTRTATGTTRYRCVITDSGNETAESRGIDTEIKVTVTDTLRISRQPSGMGMYVDKDGKLTVEAAGMIKSFQWQYYDPAEKAWKNCSAGTGANKTAEGSGEGSGEGVYTAVDGVTKYIDGKSEYSFRASDYEEVGSSVQLRCVVTDVTGKTVTSSAATVRRISHMALTDKSDNVILHKGEKTTIRVAMTGDGLRYQWQSYNESKAQWVNISRATSNSYAITTNTRTATGTTRYRCVITDSGNETAESRGIDTEIKVTVTDTLRISRHPSGMGMYVDKDGKLTVEAAGMIKSFQWQYYAPSDKTWKNCSAGTGANKTAEGSGEGVYTAVDGVTKYIDGKSEYSFSASDYEAVGSSVQLRCVVTDVTGKTVTSSAATVRRISHMALTDKSDNVILHKGEKTTIRVAMTGDGLRYQWQSYNESSGKWVNISRATSNSYAITTNTRTATGTTRYRCVITDSGNETAESRGIDTEIKVTVTDTLRISRHPSGMGMYVDKDGKLTVEAAGMIKSFQWQYYDPAEKVWKNCSAGTGANKTAEGSGEGSGEGVYTAVDGVTKYIDGKSEYSFRASDYEAVGSSVQLRCVVTDVTGKTVTSSAATVRRISHMALTDKSDNVILHKGERTTIRVAMTGDGLKYQWQSYNESSGKWVNISRATSNSYAITTNTRTATGTTRYRCVVTDSGNETAESRGIDTEIKVTVTDTLRISRQPSGMGMYVDKDGKLTVEAAGMIKSFQWQYYDPSDKTWKNCSAGTGANKTAEGSGEGVYTAVDGVTKYIEGKSEYSFRASDYEEVGSSVQLRCVVTDVTGKTVTSSAATVRRISHMERIEKSDNVILHKGERTTIRVAMTGDGLKYQWQSYNESSDKWVNISRATSNSYAITTNTRTATGTTRYRCVITDSGNETAESRGIDTEITVKVIDRVTITRQPAATTVYEGENASFSLTAVGEVDSYQWQKLLPGGKEWINIGDDSPEVKLAQQYGTNSGTLVQCIITDVAGAKVVSKTAVMKVIGPTRITEQPVKNLYLDMGDKGTVSVSSTGENVRYQWQLYSESEDEWKDVRGATGKTYTFTTSKTSVPYILRYRCVLSDATKRQIISDECNVRVDQQLSVAKQPVNTVVYDGEIATYNVLLNGRPTGYQWQKYNSSDRKWYDITGADSYQYRVTADRALNGSLYRCMIKDDAGKVVYSSQASLKVVDALEIVSQPDKTISINKGDSKTLALTVKGDGLRYQWYIKPAGTDNWKALSTASTVKITASNTNMTENQYRCIITDSTGRSINSKVYTLKVRDQLAIVSQPTAKTVYDYDVVTLSVRATGYDVTYRWQYKATGSNNWEYCDNGNGADYTFITAIAKSNYMYRCEVSDASEKKLYSNQVAVRVIGKISITNNLDTDKVINSGDKVTFAVTATGDGLKYQWQSLKDSKTASWTNISRATAANYTFTASNTSYNGMSYRCVITDSKNSVEYSTACKLEMIKTMTITDQPKSATIHTGEMNTFTIGVSGEPVNYEWQIQMPSGSWQTVQNGASAAYTVDNASLDMNGAKCRCIVTDRAGKSLTSSAVTLNVIKLLSITAQPESATCYKYETASFAVTAEGGGLKYQWQQKLPSEEDWTNIVNATGSTYSFTISGSRVDQTKYRCVITDAAGASLTSREATITILVKAKILTQPGSVSSSEGSAAGFTVVAEGDGITYQWQSNESGSYADISSATESKYVFTVPSGYNANTGYRCKITDKYGNTVYSNGVRVSTGKYLRAGALGIDVSHHQGTINWSSVKNSSNGDFAIIRLGYGDNITSQDDRQAIYNMNQCEALGIPYGVYLYSYAVCEEEAYSEVAHIKRMLNGRKPALGAFIDIEDSTYYENNGLEVGTYDGIERLTRYTKIVLDGISSMGIKAGYYCNVNYHSNYLDTSQLDGYLWIAGWGDYQGYATANNALFWQYSNSGSVSGIDGRVDLNRLMKDIRL